MSSYCKFLANYNTKLSVDVSEIVHKNHKTVTALMHVEFNNPKSINGRRIPHNHIPCHPSKVGQIALARLTYYDNQSGNWIYSVINQTGHNAKEFKRTEHRNRVIETFTFTFKIPLNTEWDSFRGQFKLFDIYENNYSHAECSYYSSANILIYNDDNTENPQACKDLTMWEPSDVDLPDQIYPIIALKVGDLFGMRYPAKITSVKIAPTKHIIPYVYQKDFDGCFRNNIVELSFMEPGIYAIRINFVGGSDTRFFTIGATFANNIAPFSRMVAIPTPNHSQNYAYTTSNSKVFQIANQFIGDLRFVSTTNIVNDLNNYQGTDLLNLIICGDGDAGEIFVSGENWFMDSSCQPSLALKQFLAAAHGCVRNICFFNPLVAVGLASTCHLLQYMATSLESASPYDSPYRPPLDYVTICAYNTPIAVVCPGNVRDGYLCFSQTGSVQEVTAYPGSGLTSLAGGRESTKGKPSFYNKFNLV